MFKAVKFRALFPSLMPKQVKPKASINQCRNVLKQVKKTEETGNCLKDHIALDLNLVTEVGGKLVILF